MFKYRSNISFSIWTRLKKFDSRIDRSTRQRYLEKVSQASLLTYLNSFHKFHLHPPDLYPSTYIHFTNNTSPSLSLSIMSHSSSRPIYNLSSFDRIGTGREIAVPIGRTEGIPYRWKNKLSFERSSNNLREQRILMTECPVSSAFHPVFLVINVAKERERKIFWHWISRRPIRRGMITFSRTWRGQFNLSLISLNRSTFFSFSFAPLVVEFKIGRRESGVCYLEEEQSNVMNRGWTWTWTLRKNRYSRDRKCSSKGENGELKRRFWLQARAFREKRLNFWLIDKNSRMGRESNVFPSFFLLLLIVLQEIRTWF